MTAATLGRRMHDAMCRSGPCTSRTHINLWVARARAALATPDAATHLHDTCLCDVELDPSLIPCPDRDRHTAHIRTWMEAK